MATYIVWPVRLFRSVFYWLNSSFFLKDLPFFMSVGDIDEACKFWSIVIPSFVCLTLNLKNLMVSFSFVSTLNILFNSEITFLWKVSFPQNIKLSTCIVRSTWDIGIMVTVFANGPGDLGSIPIWVIPKTQKMVLDASLLNTQHYKVGINGKVEQSRERSSALPYTLV